MDKQEFIDKATDIAKDGAFDGCNEALYEKEFERLFEQLQKTSSNRVKIKTSPVGSTVR